jgi:serine/threonine protein phosphatase PrpC
MMCPACVAEMPDEDLFCENCGLKLGDPAPPSGGCVCSELDEDGYCLSCGRRVHGSASQLAEASRPTDPTDHIELALSPVFAAVSDRGRKHARNEDRFGIFEAGSNRALVVCDGVSTSRNAEVASTTVSASVLESLAADLRAAEVDGIADPAAAVRRAIVAGAARLAASEHSKTEDNPPSTTVVAALLTGTEASIGWMGDSRAYWIEFGSDIAGAATALSLTRDHSWLNDVVGAHELTPEQAAKSPQAHAITRWIGSDAGEELEIDIVRHPIPANTNGILLLCTDGLWNYFPSPEAMAGIVQTASQNVTDALAIARQLVELANGRGGHDNITAAVLRCGAPEHTESGKDTASARKGIENIQ